MAQYTPNFNLYEPDSSDDFADFRTEFNNNMNIIDQNLGGGGGSGGHTIIDENDTPMTQRTGLQFTGNVSVSDDAVNDKTVVDILGGGGNVYGAFIDTDRLITSGIYTGSLSYTATEDCFFIADIASNVNTSASLSVDGVAVNALYNAGTGTVDANFYIPLRQGQTLTIANGSSWACSYKVYGIKQGTNGIYAPVIYSDNERVIGVWRDNKPLYQKTIYTNNATVNNAVTISVSSLNIDSLVDIKGTYDRIVNWISPPLHIVYCFNGFESNNEQSFVRYDKDDNNILYRITVDSNEATSYQAITIRYTKTTDVAGSGNWNTDGVPTHHYSTSEQVIGTWIDGKPLYEITLTHSGALIVDNSFANDIGSLVDVDQFIGCEGYFRRTNANGLMYSLNGGTRPEGGADSYKVTTRFYNGNVQVAVNGYNDIEFIALTVFYTKTTD